MPTSAAALSSSGSRGQITSGARRQVGWLSLDPDVPLGRADHIRVCLRQEQQACPERLPWQAVEGANLSAAELKVFRKAASIMLELGEDQIETEVEAGRLVEVKDDEQA